MLCQLSGYIRDNIYMNGTETSYDKYQFELNGNLDVMEDIREEMIVHCDQLDSCPMGCGATGKVSGNRMTGGQILSVNEMNEMQQRERWLRDEMNRFGTNCVGAGSNTSTDVGIQDCDSFSPEHFDNMEQMLEEQYQSCDGMMRDNRNEMMGDNGYMNDDDCMNYGGMMGR